MSQKKGTNRTKSEPKSDSDLVRMPGPAHGVEAIGFTASLLIIAVIVSYLAHRFGIIHRSVIPMHGPVLLGGMVLSPVYGAVLGVLIPAVSSGLTGFLAAGQALLSMVELAACGAATSFTISTLIRRTPSATWLGWILRGAVAVVTGLVAAFLAYTMVSVTEIGNVGFRYLIDSFFASSYLSYLVVVAAIPVVGLKLRKSADH